MNQWRIKQCADGEWAVWLGDVYHYAQTPDDAVDLMVALNNKGV